MVLLHFEVEFTGFLLHLDQFMIHALHVFLIRGHEIFLLALEHLGRTIFEVFG